MIFLLFFLAVPCSLQDCSSLTRYWTQATAVNTPSLNHWATRSSQMVFWTSLRQGRKGPDVCLLRLPCKQHNCGSGQRMPGVRSSEFCLRACRLRPSGGARAPWPGAVSFQPCFHPQVAQAPSAFFSVRINSSFLFIIKIIGVRCT